MNIYVGKYWEPFPYSEYGGRWVVVAQSKKDCVRMLADHNYYVEVPNFTAIEEAVDQAACYELAYFTNPRVVEFFVT